MSPASSHPVLSARVAFLLSLTAAVALPQAATAQTVGRLQNAPVDLQLFRPAVDSKGFITLNASQILAPKDFSFGLTLTWAREPLSLEGTSGGEPSSFRIENLLTPTFQGAVGVFARRQIGLEIGIAVPVSIMSGKADPEDPNNTPNNGNDDRDYRFDGQGLGDIAIHPKLRISNASRNKVGFSLIPSLILQTGDKNAFFGEGNFIFQPTAVVDTELGRGGWFRAALNVGMRMRTAGTTQFIDEASRFPRPVNGMPRNTGLGIEVGNELIAGAGVSVAVVPQKFDIVAEVYSFPGLGKNKLIPSGDTMKPASEAIAGIKLYLARNSFFLAGGGYGFMGDYAAARAGRLFVGFIFEPSIGDRDHDGYKDDVDLCPDDPEDFDDFEDEDGCPDPDNDKDGILDVDDKCPNDPETRNGFKD
ncbi:MAG TPA: transporter, partial [Polyangia bacterium]